MVECTRKVAEQARNSGSEFLLWFLRQAPALSSGLDDALESVS